MKKPKKLKFPKAPRANASVEIWERYHKRCVDIKKRNEERERPYKNKASKIATIRSQVAKLKGVK